MKKIKFVQFLCAMSFMLAFSQCSAKKAEITEELSEEFKIKPPIQNVDVKFASFEFESKNGGQFTYKTGTQIQIPANALQDKNGKEVKGKVKLEYREFHNALDVFLSGIPMKYDSAGIAQNFQTAGMFQIKASQNGEEVFLKKDKKANINMASFQGENDYNFYQLDPKTGAWNYKTQSKVVPNQEKVKQIALLKQKMPIAMQDMLLLNFGQALDISLHQTNLHKFDAMKDPFMNKLVKEYEVDYLLGLQAVNRVSFQGNQYPAFDLVWKKVNPTQVISNYVRNLDQYRNRDHSLNTKSEVIPLRPNVYQLRVKKNDIIIFAMEIQPLMRVSSLLKYPASYWKNNYATAMQEIEKEEAKIAEVGDFFREMQIEEFGVFNYDRYYQKENTLLVNADFLIEGRQEKPTMVYYVNPVDRVVVKYEPTKWSEFSLQPLAKNIKIFAIMPDYSIAVLNQKNYAQIDFQKLKAMEKPSLTLKLKINSKVPKSREAVALALNIN